LRWPGLWTAGIAVTTLWLAAPTAARGQVAGSFTRHTFSAPGLPARDYWVYLPAGLPAGAPLVVFLHGCLESATQAAAATHFNQLADREQRLGQGFALVYPQQTVTRGNSALLADGNRAGCWNWFLPGDQHRGVGEPATIAAITSEVAAAEHNAANRIFVEGVSAGADMAVILAATYPDVYDAVASLAGCPYGTCKDLTGTQTFQAMGPRARVVPMFVEQGTADTINPLPLSQALVESWLGTDSLVDKAVVARESAATENHDFGQTPRPGTGDPCVRPSNWPCPGGVVGFQGSYPYTVEHYADPKGCDILDFWVVHGMEHAHPDADPAQPWTDPLGPDVTTASYEFFVQHGRSACVPLTGERK
jgi:poly(hydroxyalkanoate) depolymerase family esterase